MAYTRNVDKNLLTMIDASVNTGMFRRLFVKDENGMEIDVLEDGVLSCAYYTTSLLTLAGRIDHPHTTVATTVKIFEESPAWEQVTEPHPGDIVYWGPGVHGHTHAGFYVGNGEVVSTSASLGVPVRHNLRMSDDREPEAFWHYHDAQTA